MNPQACRLGQFHGLRVDRACVAIKHDVGDAVGVDQVGKISGPVFFRVTVGDISCSAKPESTVARVKADAPYLTASFAQHFSEPVEKWPVWSL